ncbi:aminotransferase class V-fold PLP-dependent enzyme [Streptomyces clavuligerus]|uniref:Isopenicillin N epimerase n=2 Tax=Streptomyces clavuligerus TaxID=1901 RepID=CEFD_STRCL|nr:aminotransferase class V-fold PLP-dependent enzyme [Streptomyces clavuligerus]P18549.3 RecName: Full=Isopenicillin N epimerase [Streptomyces clavuligerus]AAA26714.1 isopenicillin N epimerase (cefD) [Streptomyces clavuligerus]ANW18123.1 penicillin epimerase [Streptomyces clavuligerus]AXU12685.1 aminotransferase class V-fold PLP-dependent enzyme [Streptomyces clavuligerus]EDY47107.1 isopenicillin N epimerase [Streptomyces clavuligerus]EFG09285.1 Isopenicillin N epimerase [Streptomyces clavul
MAVADWEEARGRMLLDPTVVNLNTGSGGPLPRSAFERVTGFRAHLAAEPMDFLLREVPALLWQARESLARLIGGDPLRLALATNVTAAVNLVASSLRLEAPGEILLSDDEYTPMRWCWERVARRHGLELRTFRLPELPSDPAEITAAAVAAMGPRTRLFFFSHVVSTTGLILPAAELCEEARARGITTVVDGAHAPGFLDLDLSRIPCDFYAGSGHKWLLAPTGVGFLHLAPGRLEELEPTQVSWAYEPPEGSGPPAARDRFGSTPGLRRLECEGTRDICPWLATPESIDFQAELGPGAIRARRRELTDHARRLLADRPGRTLLTPDSPELSGGMVAYRLPPGTDAAELRRGLWERFRIEAAVAEQPPGPVLRISANFYTTEEEIDRLADALDALTGE